MHTDSDDKQSWQEPPLWRLLFDPRGRVSRRTWWLWAVLMPLAMGLLLFALFGIARVAPDRAEQSINLLLLWPIVAVSIKRWHDTDRSAWWVLIVLLPLVGWIVALWCNGVLRGTPGANRYGADPLVRRPLI